MHINEKPELAFSEAEQAGSATINYQQTKWNANLIVSYADKRQMANGNQRITLDSYWLLSGKLQYNFTSQLGAFIQAKNLLDDEYLTPATGSSLTEGVPNRGRELLSGISWKF
jgi:outer membrane receptor protein involved in Fe transport